MLWLAVPDGAIEQVAAEVAQALGERARRAPACNQGERNQGTDRGARNQGAQRAKASKALARGMAPHTAQPGVVLHASGALSSEALAALAARGIQTGSAHPMMTFVAGEPPDLRGAWFAVEGTAAAVRRPRGRGPPPSPRPVTAG